MLGINGKRDSSLNLLCVQLGGCERLRCETHGRPERCSSCATHVTSTVPLSPSASAHERRTCTVYGPGTSTIAVASPCHAARWIRVGTYRRTTVSIFSARRRPNGQGGSRFQRTVINRPAHVPGKLVVVVCKGVPFIHAEPDDDHYEQDQQNKSYDTQSYCNKNAWMFAVPVMWVANGTE